MNEVKKVFITPTKKQYRLVVRTHKTSKDGDVVQEPVYIIFKEGKFDPFEKKVDSIDIEPQELIDFIKSRPNYGVDFFEVDELDVPSTHGYQGGNEVVSLPMEREKERSNEDIEELKSQVSEITNQVSEITKAVSMIVESMDSTNKNKNKNTKSKK